MLDVTIRRVGNQQLWRIAWILKHASGQTNGFVHLETLELEAAFGLREHLDEDSGALLARYGASSAIQEKFIRYERWLNLPGPGTGLDGDPNVSIDVDDGIKDAVAQLIANRYR